MKLNYYIDALSGSASAIESLARGASVEQARWKPSPEEWSIVEVVNHLYDEEREDFRARLDSLLHYMGREWPPIDPAGWVAARRYIEKDLEESLERFLSERRSSLTWLKELKEPRWDFKHERPQGALSAGDLLAAWAAHDLLHVRQLTRLRWQYLNLLSEPYKTAYAGEW